MGVADSFHPTPVGVYFGKPGAKAADPYFGGAGPERVGCTECGSCMTGCRVGAKNTLVKNYLYLAEQDGAQVIPLTTVTSVRPVDGGYQVDLKKTGTTSKRFRTTITAEQVVFAAGTWGTQNLLHKHEGHRHAAEAFAAARRADPHELRGDHRRGAHRGRLEPELQPRRRDHVVDPPGREHPHRAGPLRQGQQRDEPAADDRDRRRVAGAALAAGGELHGQAPGPDGEAAQRLPLERAHGDPAGDAEPGQLDHDVHEARPVRPPQVHVEAGPRRAEPELHPGRATRPTSARRTASAASRAARGARSSTSR